MAVAAVRIPDPRVAELPLRFVPIGPQILVHEGARQTLERRLQAACEGPVQLGVTDNRRRMISRTRARGTLRVRVHMMFLGAPERIVDALVRFIVSDDRQSSQVLGEFIARNTHRIRADRPVVRPLRTRGQRHDLGQILQAINEAYFGSAVADVLVTWGRRSRPAEKKRASIKLGSYSALERLIRVHPCLDAEWVPRYFVGYIVYHELLHHLIPPSRAAGRALLHPADFLERERSYRYYERAIAWEQRHIERLLRCR